MNNKILAELYEKFFCNNLSDFEFYKYFVKKGNGLALEIGSGTGRLLLQMLNSGLEVEGIEPDLNMTEICTIKSKNLNLKPTIYSQNLQNIKLTKKYKTIYMPLYVFQQIIHKNEIISSLKRIYEHLANDGQVLISIFLPWNDPTATWENTWRILKNIKENNINYILSESISFDKFNQIETKFLKYEIFQENYLAKTFFTDVDFRTYSIQELYFLFEQIGFKDIEIFGDYTLQEANNNTDVFIFKGSK